MIEASGSASEREDAEHWTRVYRELIWAAEALLVDLTGNDPASVRVRASLDRRVASLRARLGYWEAELDRGSGREPT